MLAGFLRGEPVELVKAKTVDLEVPANAEIVLEGYVEAGDEGIEGPVRRSHRLLLAGRAVPVFHLTAMTMRRDAIYPSIVVGKPPAEDAWLGKATERIFLPAIRMTVPEIVDYDLPVAGAFHGCAIVSIRKAYPGHAQKVMHAIWGLGLLSLTKSVVVVDEHVDVHDYDDVVLPRLRERRPEARRAALRGPARPARPRADDPVLRRQARHRRDAQGARGGHARVAAGDRDERRDHGRGSTRAGPSTASPLSTDDRPRHSPRRVKCYVVDTARLASVESASAKRERGESRVDPEQGQHKPDVPGPSVWPIGVAIGVAVPARRPGDQLVDRRRSAARSPSSSVSSGCGDLSRSSRGEGRRPAPAAAEPGPPRPASAPRPSRRRRRATASSTASTLGLGAVIGVFVTVPPIGLRSCPPFLKQSKKPVDLGPIDQSPQNQWLITTFLLVSRHGPRSRAAPPSSATTASLKKRAELHDHLEPLRAPRLPGAAARARPGHQEDDPDDRARKSPTTPVLAVSGFSCPCHGGAYDTEGNRTAGPPVARARPLRVLDRQRPPDPRPTTASRRSTAPARNAQIHKYDLAGPGQHVDGLEQIFYPIQPPS